MEGYAAFHRKIVEWKWYTDANTFRLFFHLILMANHKDNNWKGIDVKRGQIITGRKTLAKELCLTEQQIRTSINKLISTNEITIEPTNKFTLVTIVNYDFYQTTEAKATNKSTNKITNNQPTNNQQITTNNNDNNDNNEKQYKYKEVYDYYLTLDLFKHKRYTNEMTKAMKHAETNLGIDTEHMKRMLKRHEEKVIKTQNDQYKTKARELSVFFGQKKANSTVLICSDYLDEHYQDVKQKPDNMDWRNVTWISK